MPKPKAKARGRPRGPKKVQCSLRVSPEQKYSLRLLSEIMEGAPPVNGLIQAAIDRFIAHKLEDQALRAQYNAKVKPRLKVMA